MGITNPDPLMTTEQAAEYLGVKTSFIRVLIRTGRLRYIALTPRKYKVAQSALDAYIKRQSRLAGKSNGEQG